MASLELFTREERDIIEEFIQMGKPRLISSKLVLDDPRKEQQLVDYLDNRVKPKVVFESKVKSEIEELQAKGVNPFETPEQAEEWDERLREERQKHLEKIQFQKEAKKKKEEPKKEDDK